ncbi:alpha/beta hydrolase [Umezawaea tangerina]|uniref:Alpha-beta hydrolase superfamily lysophospholipase n=1 Tax=Umezawaea tangerina TaxID=84725 RepID=A0A2T0TAB7_9PSEU|nr:alpha/beta hydrolase [Umezawaea tangerina]PRY42600.1 alpha-beta hydrolase superfamily lysophospholipase [Umezawaea tangerina]
MTADVLGADFETRTLATGEATATLVRHRAREATRGAILYVHGWADYFFQRHVAEHYAALGFDFYAVDLRAYGRSWRQGQTPNFVTDLADHLADVDGAVRAVREDDGHSELVLMGHSTGGLIAALWAHERRADGLVDALVLNSPWFDLAEPWIMQTVGTAVVRGLGRVSPKLVVKPGLGPVYGQSIHRDHHGEWDFDLTWKPLEAFPVYAGWLRAIRIGHSRLQGGLDVRVPSLVLRSSASHLHAKAWTEQAMVADAVLDVAHIERFAPKLGGEVTSLVVQDGLHDLFLSREDVRKRAFEVVDEFLDGRVR